MYHRGTLTEFNAWHTTAMVAEGITLPDGKIGYVNDQPAPNNQKTTAYSKAYQNPDESDDYIWIYGSYQDGTSYTREELQAFGWFAEEV